ncbi:MAG: PQQ-dependent sugar dehydrogenase [Alphaproteobacteria bacterium]|nr:PQQ-dependent sugar dehydrogenase [Alphaproteobacteria bacterium]
MKTSPLFLALAASVAIAAPAIAQFAPPKPTAEQLERTIREDQLSDPKCGVPRNAADDYRPKPMHAWQTHAPRMTPAQNFKVEEVASGLEHPWSMAFLPDGKMLVTIRGKGLVVVGTDGAVSDILPGTPPIRNAVPLFGMHDAILDRDFAKTRTIYLAYATTPDGSRASVGYIASAKLAPDDLSVTDFKVLKEGAMTPRRLAQAKDGTLLAITADIITPYKSAQSLASPQGKVLRINTDGSIPKSNPYVGKTDADPSIYAVGFRDAQGLAFRPGTNQLWTVENEPRGGDEVDIVKAGKNYGFPLISYGRDNDGKPLGTGETAGKGLEQPVYFWNPSIAVSGLLFYTGKGLPGWTGDMFVGGLSGMQLMRLKLKGDRIVGEEKLLRDRCERYRDVKQGPDGLIYVVTEEENGKILKLAPG